MSAYFNDIKYILGGKRSFKKLLDTDLSCKEKKRHLLCHRGALHFGMHGHSSTPSQRINFFSQDWGWGEGDKMNIQPLMEVLWGCIEKCKPYGLRLQS